jgi:hypothetical protein
MPARAADLAIGIQRRGDAMVASVHKWECNVCEERIKNKSKASDYYSSLKDENNRHLISEIDRPSKKSNRAN